MLSDAVLIYDADCGFCRSSLAFGRRILPWTPRAIGFQHADLAEYGLTDAEARRSVHLVRRGRPNLHGAAAIAAILQAQPSVLWRVAGQVMATLPISWIAEGCYRLVARYRTRLRGWTCAARS